MDGARECGATVAEYALMVVLMGIATLLAVMFFADSACDVHESNVRSIAQQAVVAPDGGGCANLSP